MSQMRLIALVAALVAATGTAAAQQGLGDPMADAMVSELQARSPARQLDCRISGDFVVCAGARVGDCLAAGWLVNHDGRTCRKEIAA